MNLSGSKRTIGNIGEDVACQFLKKKGYEVIERNYRKPWGEVDVVASKGGVVKFVEVKAVTGSAPGDFSREMSANPEELIDSRKLKKIARTAELYMQERKDTREYQIDAVGVILDLKGRKARCRLFEQVLGE